jgi:hypothetical protein
VAEYQPTPNVLETAKAKIAGREDAFVQACAEKRDRYKVCREFGLSFEAHDVLTRHFWWRIQRAQQAAGEAAIERSQPPGDRT